MGLTTESRALGVVWVTFVADTLGGPVQVKPPGTFKYVTPYSKSAV